MSIICEKGLKWFKHKGVCKRDKLIKCVTVSAKETLKQCATIRKDSAMLGKISGEDLIAKEAHYHEVCRKVYINTSKLSCGVSTENQEEDIELRNMITKGHLTICQNILKLK